MKSDGNNLDLEFEKFAKYWIVHDTNIILANIKNKRRVFTLFGAMAVSGQGLY